MSTEILSRCHLGMTAGLNRLVCLKPCTHLWPSRTIDKIHGGLAIHNTNI